MTVSKEQILGEIKRTAEKNGGTPLGQARFTEETGIRNGDWFGKYWARWSDALVEAGYSPNSFATAYDESELLEKYAALALELGRLPVKGDLLMKARSSDFPNEKVFYRRYGGKPQLILRLTEYLQGRPEFEQVLQLCLLEKPKPSEAEIDAPEKAQPLGYVYLLKSGRHYKIGKTNSVGRRERELAIQLPQKATMVHQIATDDPTGIENYWHRRFAEKRQEGEWFELTAQDITAFKRRKFM